MQAVKEGKEFEYVERRAPTSPVERDAWYWCNVKHAGGIIPPYPFEEETPRQEEILEVEISSPAHKQ